MTSTDSPPQFHPRTSHYRQRVEDSFNRQQAMQTLGISLDRVAPGEVDLGLPYQFELSQQHGFIHAGVIATALDSACGYAAFSLMAEDAAVLTVEFKISLLAPAQGERFVALGRVVKPGRTITFAHGEAWAQRGDERKLIAQMNATLMAVVGRDEIRG
ncbi:MAG: PaaI family thioesterase [bacterium]